MSEKASSMSSQSVLKLEAGARRLTRINSRINREREGLDQASGIQRLVAMERVGARIALFNTVCERARGQYEEHIPALQETVGNIRAHVEQGNLPTQSLHEAEAILRLFVPNSNKQKPEGRIFVFETLHPDPRALEFLQIAEEKGLLKDPEVLRYRISSTDTPWVEAVLRYFRQPGSLENAGREYGVSKQAVSYSIAIVMRAIRGLMDGDLQTRFPENVLKTRKYKRETIRRLQEASLEYK